MLLAADSLVWARPRPIDLDLARLLRQPLFEVVAGAVVLQAVVDRPSQPAPELVPRWVLTVVGRLPSRSLRWQLGLGLAVQVPTVMLVDCGLSSPRPRS
jgi:hypothetical protein